MGTTISSFFVLGLLGGFGHCVGMCNPFVLYVACRFHCESTPTWHQRLVPHLFYNLGRISTYSSLGLLCGILGKISGDLTHVQGIASLLAGGFLIFYGLAGLLGKNLAKKLESSAIIKAILGVVKGSRPSHPFFVGLALGLLPCGLVYSALAGAIALGHPLSGGVAMASFGSGTAIAMMIAAFGSGYLIRKRGLLHTFSMCFLIGMGAYFIWFG